MFRNFLAIIGIVTPLVTGASWLYSNQNTKIENVNQRLGGVDVQIGKLQEAVETIKSDNAETRKDIKEFLFQLNKKNGK